MDYDAFLSHHSADKLRVRELRRRLMAQDLRCWFDAEDLRPGQPWQKGLEAGIRDARAVLVCLGESGIGPWEDEEMQAALDLAAHRSAPCWPSPPTGCSPTTLGSPPAGRRSRSFPPPSR